MSKILVLYYSSYGHTENMARIIAEGAGGVDGAEVTIKRVPELVSEKVMQQANYKLDQPAPVATIDELPEYDAYIFGTPTRYGNMCSQMRNFLDQTGGLWLQGAFVGKVGSAFVTTACQHGGQETTLTSFHTNLLHMGMIVVGVPFSCSELLSIDQVSGGSPYGAGSISTRDGSRPITEKERAIGLFQGKHVAEVVHRQTVSEQHKPSSST